MSIPNIVWLESLTNMAAMLGPSKSLQNSIQYILHCLSHEHNFLRPHLILYDPQSGMLELSHADTAPESKDSKYSPGFGITGQVFASGQAIIVEVLQDNPSFRSLLYHRTAEEMATLSFISVPVFSKNNKMQAKEVIGTLNADCCAKDYDELVFRKAFLELVAAMLSLEVDYLQEDLRREKYAQSVSIPNHELIAKSKKMRQVIEQAQNLALGSSPILLIGEAGTGKESVAKFIHSASSRADMPLIKCNLAQIPKEILELELFGFQKGAFDGAIQSNKGLFEQANKSTLLLEGIENLSAEMQKNILDLIKNNQIQRIGGSSKIDLDLRLIFTSSQSNQEINKEFFLRLSSIYIPALQERPEDILPLCEHFLKSFSKKIKRITLPAIELLERYPWHGNIPQLKSCLEYAVEDSQDGVIRAINLPPSLQTARSSSTSAHLSFVNQVESFERELITEALIHAEGNMLKAAKDLNTSYRIINYKIKKLGIDPKQTVYKTKNKYESQ